VIHGYLVLSSQFSVHQDASYLLLVHWHIERERCTITDTTRPRPPCVFVPPRETFHRKRTNASWRYLQPACESARWDWAAVEHPSQVTSRNHAVWPFERGSTQLVYWLLGSCCSCGPYPSSRHVLPTLTSTCLPTEHEYYTAIP
jgi:hypothetical protein